MSDDVMHDNNGYAAVRRGAATAVGVALVLIVAALLWRAATVLLAVFGGVIVALAVRAAAVWLAERTRMPASAGVLVVVLAVLGSITLLTWVLADDVAAQVRELVHRLPIAIDRLSEALARREWGRSLLALVRSTPGVDVQRLLGGQIPSVLGASFGMAAAVGVGAFVALYVAFDPDVYRRGVLAVVPSAGRARAAQILDGVGLTLRRWLVGRLVAMLLIGALTALGLWLIGIPLGITLGLLAGLLNFVPYIGPLVSFVPAGLIAVLQGPAAVVWVLVLYVLVQTIESYLVTPLVQQRAVDLPPALTITAQVILGLVFGGIGLLLATPLTAAVLVVVQLLYVEDVLHQEAHVRGAKPPAAVA